MPEEWKSGAEIDRALPRPVRLTGTGKWLWLASALLVVGGGWGGAGGVRASLRTDAEQAAAARRMLVEGRETEAVVTALSQSAGKVPAYEVDYQFAVEGQTYLAHDQIGWRHWNDLQVGSRMAVRYLASNPTRVYPSADPPQRRASDWFFPLMVGAAIAGIGVWPLAILWRQCRFLAGGRSAKAVVTQCVGVKTRDGVTYTFHYEFPLREGAPCQGSYELGLRPIEPPPEGSVIHVVYDAENPRRNVPYPMWLVEVTGY